MTGNLDNFSLKKRYYFSMLSLLPLLWAFGLVFFGFHKSIKIYLHYSLLELILHGIINLTGVYIIYRPIDGLLKRDLSDATENGESFKRINSLSRYSALWTFSLGIVHILFSVLPIIFFPELFSSEVFAIEKIPISFILGDLIPGMLFVYAILPSFIIFLLINDFTLDLKSKIFSSLNINFNAGTKRIAILLLFVSFILILFPTVLVILELTVNIELSKELAQFSTLTPLQTVLINRFIVLIGMIIAVILLSRSFTKPIDSLLNAINKVADGDYSTQAPVISQDEIGILTKEFNEMVKGLKEREFIRDTFGKYVTNDVADVILNKQINLGGEVRLCTILVTDIANYTSISEELSPQEIVTMLNEYFSVHVKVIQDNQGVVNEFIGDSIFALFNVPLDDPAHAENAIKAALEIERISNSHKFGNQQKLATRIGINTGMVVAGNIGSDERMKYTVIGDEVNIAARLEQLNKEHGTQLLIGENTYELAKSKFDFDQLGKFQLKGKEKLIKVFTAKQRKTTPS